MNSLRWEMVREGIEDHDYLTVLLRAIDAARRRLGVTDSALSGRTRAKALCATVAPNVQRSTTDPHVLAAARLHIAREILFYHREPDVVFAAQAAVGRKRIVGRTAPGTRIRIGGAPVRVDAAGAFDWTSERGARSVQIEASSGTARKSLTVPL